ncbi:MAG: hypothetical protein NC180_02080 [Muribaculaceae bacterium]|nr:hypothetical protein [Roseburia sp.]MCM1432232.1 hypothetical protein [Muribaculaceae bacterium]MCM1491991.1 hypothetical protein [Muribaculaceae bacterium]
MTIGTNYDLFPNYNSYAGEADALPNHPHAKEAGSLRLPGQEAPDAAHADKDEQKKAGRRSSPAECETCKNRKYKDGSDEANVSFKSASHISPEAAGAAVRAHENEHVANAYNKAAKNNGKVLSATVSIHTAICPECGRSYISGGTTNTMIRYTNEENPYQKELKAADATRLRGAHLDLTA